MDERPAGTPIAVAEGVDGLKLSMSHCRMGKRRDIRASHEGLQIPQEFFHLILVGRDEQRITGRVFPPADPYRLGTELAGDFRRILTEQHPVHGADGIRTR
nr:hypothetical protein [uncultured Corynebacterium sp.]